MESGKVEGKESQEQEEGEGRNAEIRLKHKHRRIGLLDMCLVCLKKISNHMPKAMSVTTWLGRQDSWQEAGPRAREFGFVTGILP